MSQPLSFPQSGRTAGGHRLWSEKQVVQLRWVKARNEEGLQTGHAIRALAQLIPLGSTGLQKVTNT